MKDLSQIVRLTVGLTAGQSERLEGIKTDVRVALARVFGNDLSDMMVDALLNEAICHPTVLMAVEGLPNVLPVDRSGWNSLASEIASDNDLAQRNISFSREARLNERRTEELSKLSGQQRINLARSGNLDEYIEARVRDQIERAK